MEASSDGGGETLMVRMDPISSNAGPFKVERESSPRFKRARIRAKVGQLARMPSHPCRTLGGPANFIHRTNLWQYKPG